MSEIKKLDNVTWYGHCVIHVMAALNELTSRGQAEILVMNWRDS